MILQERHKQFAVISFERFMSYSQTIDAFYEKFTEDLPKPQPMQKDHEEYERQVEQHNRATKERIYHQLRRYDIRHMEFPQKYRELFE